MHEYKYKIMNEIESKNAVTGASRLAGNCACGRSLEHAHRVAQPLAGTVCRNADGTHSEAAFFRAELNMLTHGQGLNRLSDVNFSYNFFHFSGFIGGALRPTRVIIMILPQLLPCEG